MANFKRSKEEKIEAALQKVAAEAVINWADNSSLITVTRVQVAPSRRVAFFFVSVLPIDRANAAISLLDRKKPEFRDIIRSKLKMQYMPSIRWVHDKGEANRSRILQLLQDEGADPEDFEEFSEGADSDQGQT